MVCFACSTLVAQGPRIRPKKGVTEGKTETVWASTDQTKSSKGEPTGKLVGEPTGKLVSEKDANLTKTEGCAGEWTRAVCEISAPAQQNMLVIRDPVNNSTHALQKAKACGYAPSSCSYFVEGYRMACAPYIACK